MPEQDDSYRYSQHMFRLRNKKIIFLVRTWCNIENYFHYFSTKTYVVSTYKNRLVQAFFEHPNMFKLIGKKIMTI